MPRRPFRLVTVVAVLSIASTACSAGDGDGGTAATSTTSPAATGQAQELRIVGRENRFDVETLAAPAGEEVTIVFDNRDRGIPHNIAVYRTGPPAKDQVAATELEAGPTTQRLRVPALEPGRYFYQCDAHPTTMTGTLMVSSRR